MAGWLKVRNWTRYQHYKKRTPPWIKIHRVLLDDHAFMALASASKWHLVGCWIIASEHEGQIPNDENEIRFRLRVSAKTPILKPLIDAGFLECLQDASTCVQSACLEGETETEVETETQQSENGLAASDVVDEWNKIAKQLGLERCRNMGTTRSTHFAARKKESFFQEHWREAMAAIPNLPAFYLESQPGQEWRINLQHFLLPDSVTKILEKTEAPAKPEEPPLKFNMDLDEELQPGFEEFKAKRAKEAADNASDND